MTKHIVIIGAGATGLGAAYLLKRAQDAGADLTFTLLERDNRTGGKVAGEMASDPETGQPYVIDGGPDCISAHKPAGRRTARLLGIEDDWLPSNDARKKVYLYRDGRLHELPQGFRMFVPTQLAPLFETDLLTEAGKQEMLRDLTEPPRDWTATLSRRQRRDETLESFITRRFGREVLDYLAEPFMGGVHASDPREMSLAATFPMYLDLEEKYGSVIKGTVLATAARERAAAGKSPDPKNTVFATFTGGLHELTDAMAAAIVGEEGEECVQTSTTVESITRTTDGKYCISCHPECNAQREACGSQRSKHEDSSISLRSTQNDKGEIHCAQNNKGGSGTITADAVIIATESFAAAQITADLDPELSAAYAGIPNLTSATASFAFRAEDLGEQRYDGFGVLVPEVEKRNLLAATWSSTKWQGRAPVGRVLIRGFAGTPQNQAVMNRSDEELTALILDELREVLELPARAEPLLSRCYRWTQGMSQYTMGHLDRIETIEHRVAETPGLACAGGCFRGVGVPNCIEGGENAARKVLIDLDQPYDKE